MMLISRGCPQTLDSFGFPDSLTSIESQLAELRSRLESFAGDQYIASEGCEAHCYNVKRPSGTYWYNELTSKRAILEPEEQSAKVKVIHLSHDDDPRNPEGRLGVERRNRLSQVQTQIQIAEKALQQSIYLINTSLDLLRES